MTPALKAMVEAMIAEIKAQDCLYVWDDNEVPEPNRIMFSTGIALDLEKVARAGLEAIQPPHPLDAPDIMVKGSLQQYALREAIEVILGETV